jgi:tetratricopeptide (TPR) repeat protein
VSWNAAKFRVQSSEFKVDASNLTRNSEPGTRNSAETQPHALLSTRRQFDERGFFKQVAELGVQAAQALAAAHEQGVVHRDIKPSNLLLETGGKLWVTDFGLARFQRDVSLTRTGDLIGTLRYMSPEQASGQAALVDHRTDIYSLGATLYELACLRPAFGEAEGPALLARIAAEEPRQPRQIRHEIPVDLETVILKAMAKEREHRYATAQQFAEDLRCIAEGRPPLARPPVLLARARTWVRRRRRLVGAVACVLLVACAGVAASASLIARERTKAARRVSVADQKFQATGAKNQVLARDVALAYDRLGAAHSALREPAAARESYERAIAMQQELIAKSRGDAAVQRDLAVSWNNLGLLDCRAGRVEEAEAAMRRALAILTKLVRQQPGSAALASDLGGTYANLGIVLEKRGATDLARQSYADAIEHQQLAIELAPETARYREMLAQHEQHQARVSKKPIGGSL